MKPYPLVLEPILKEKVWGGRRLERLGKRLPAGGAMIGESWELADLGSTSVDGGGGGAARSVVASGEMRGLDLSQVATAMGHNLMGSVRSSASGGFPLLVKFLDARENLSVQVHPSAAYAALHGGAGDGTGRVSLKTESWYVVEAEPGAVIYKGLRQGVTREGLRARLLSGEDISGDLLSTAAGAGEFHHLPSGTCHALGAGVMVAEIQTPSDTTFRLFDWGRTGRALHIEEALECATMGPPPRLSGVRGDGSGRCALVRTEHFEVFERRLMGGSECELENVPAFPDGGPMVWVVIGGEGRILSLGREYGAVDIERGMTVLFPAALGRSLCAVSRDATILEVRFPVARGV